MAVLIFPGNAGKGDVRNTKKFSAGTLVNEQGSLDLSSVVAGNIKPGVTIDGVAGTFTNDATAGAGHILSGYSAYTAGILRNGTIPIKGAQTYTPGTTDQTIAAVQYLSGAQIVKGDANFIAGNLKKNITCFGVTGSLLPIPDLDSFLINIPVNYSPVSYIEGEGLWCSISPSNNKVYLVNQAGTIINTITFALDAGATVQHVSPNHILWANVSSLKTYISDKSGTQIGSTIASFALATSVVNDTLSRVFGNDYNLGTILRMFDFNNTSIGTITVSSISQFIPSTTGFYWVSSGNLRFVNSSAVDSPSKISLIALLKNILKS